MTKLYHIQASPYLNAASETELISILECLLPIKFIFDEHGGIESEGAIIINGIANKDAANIPSLSLPSPANLANASQSVETEVEFADDPDVPFPFRGRKVSAKLSHINPGLSVRDNEKVLATSPHGSIWLVSESGGAKHFRSALPLPHIPAKKNFTDVFNGECFLEMLVLLHFIREITAKTAYQNPPLRAGFIIDDPNLHWPRYGFVDYRKIATHAQKENFHVSFATIPLDAWYTHTATADLFRTNSRWISLLIHGNNHAKEELALDYTDTMRKDLLRQAVQRIERLEQKANLRVCRVMVPPHGACSDEMLAVLSKSGFESACISAGSLRAHNQDKPWLKTLGFSPAEVIKGCSVFPRWGLTGNVNNTLLLAAYLGRPMILRGHHHDIKDGVEVLDEYARFINGIGDVFWSNMTNLSRLSYQWRIEGTICRLKPLGRYISFKLPDRVTEVIIEKSDSIDENCEWQITFADGSVRKIIPGKSIQLAKAISSENSIELNSLQAQPSPLTTGFKPTSASLILRRLLTEVRDRLLVY